MSSTPPYRYWSALRGEGTEPALADRIISTETSFRSAPPKITVVQVGGHMLDAVHRLKNLGPITIVPGHRRPVGLEKAESRFRLVLF